MTHETAVSLTISTIAAAVSVVAQEASMNGVSVASFLIPVLSATIGGAVSWGVLKTSVSNLNREMSQMRREVGNIYELLRNTSDRVARIEGQLDK